MDLANLMDHLEIEKAHVVGETIGGTIALEFAYQFPQRLHTVTTCTSPYKFRGVPTYLEYYNLVQEQGVEAWVRQTADRRLEPGKSDSRHHEWYVQQMSQTSQRVVLETLAYLCDGRFNALFAPDHRAYSGYGGRDQRHEYARARAAPSRTVAARNFGASTWRERLCAALGTSAMRGDMAGLCQDLQSSLRHTIFVDQAVLLVQQQWQFENLRRVRVAPGR